MSKFCHILTLPAQVCVCDTPIFLFPDNYLSKCQRILTKLGTCIDIKEIQFAIAYAQFRQFLTELSARDTLMAGYFRFMFLFSFFQRTDLEQSYWVSTNKTINYNWDGCDGMGLICD